MIEKFLKTKRTIILNGDITPEIIDSISSQMMAFQCDSEYPINLVIDSGGGSTFAALRLCDFIEHFITAPVYAFVIGECSSAATFILLHCDKRSCTQHSFFLVHSSTMMGIEIKLDKTTPALFEALLEDSRTTQETVIKMYMSKLNLNREKVEKIIARGDQAFNNELSAKEAKDIGLIQEIIQGKLPLFSHQ
jgi:ATP-dependent protease ClpP protease subunit